MTMKESQNAASFDSESFGRKETHELSYSEMDASSISFNAKNSVGSSEYKVIDDFSMDNENLTVASPTKEGQSGLSNRLGVWDKNADSFSDSYDIDKELTRPEHECLAKVVDVVNHNGSNFRESSSPCNGASDLFETDSGLITDKNVLECEVPELEFCYKEIDCQIMKDICVDQGKPEKDITVIGSCKDEKLVSVFPQTPDDVDHYKSPEDSCLDTNRLSANECWSKEENYGKILVSQRRLESSLDNSFEKDTAKHCDLENPMLTDEVNYGATDEAESESSEDALMGKNLQIEHFNEGNKVTQPPDQILDKKPYSENHSASSAEAGRSRKKGEVVKASSLLYNSEVEDRSITFSFKSPVPKVVDNGNGIAEDIEKHYADAEDFPIDTDAENLSDTREAKCTSSAVENVHIGSLIIKDENSDGGNAHERSLEPKDTTNSDDSSKDGQLQNPCNKSGSVQAVEPNVPLHEQGNFGNGSVVRQLHHDEGETSFSAASIVKKSEPFAFSGNLSHRSDSSATSGKSFAFPVLQCEWNSSPVRMAKADKGDCRKHKGWKSGILCCRF